MSINQKEYLKKYLSGGASSHKKRKSRQKTNSGHSRVQIVDDDEIAPPLAEEDVETIRNIREMGEDAPQVVAVIDDRPTTIRRLELYKNSEKWKAVGAEEAIDIKPDIIADAGRHEWLTGEQESLVAKVKTEPAEKSKYEDDDGPIYRDRKTGRKRNLKEEKLEKIKKEKEEEAKKEKYYVWGKGVKQVENEKRKMEDDLHEMSKPLARYADDEDLDKNLKQQDREDDPMLNFMNEKKKRKRAKEGIPERPQYKGSFPPNRFNIRPGYRWDGRDRSNGYERKFFENQSKRKATEEEAYRWSTSDM